MSRNFVRVVKSRCELSLQLIYYKYKNSEGPYEHATPSIVSVMCVSDLRSGVCSSDECCERTRLSLVIATAGSALGEEGAVAV